MRSLSYCMAQSAGEWLKGHGKDRRLPQWMVEKDLRDILAQ